MPKACLTKDRVAVAAAYSPTPARRKTFSETYGFAVCDTAETIFDDPSIAVVMVLTPPNTHLDLTRRAAEAGKHVLLEKPLEITQERAEALVEVAERAGVKLGIVLQHRFRPVSEALAGLISEGRLGEIVSASARLHNWRPQTITISRDAARGRAMAAACFSPRPFTRLTC